MRGSPLSLQQDWGGQTLEMFGALVCVLGVVLLCAWLLRRAPLGAGGRIGELRVVGVLTLGQRERLLVVQVGAEQVLLGVSAAGIEHLLTLDEPLSDRTAEAPEFKSALRSLVAKATGP
ncbi:MAG: flagellar biosynthetic protein FliO [Pseudomonadota bacterium]